MSLVDSRDCGDFFLNLWNRFVSAPASCISDKTTVKTPEIPANNNERQGEFHNDYNAFLEWTFFSFSLLKVV